MARPRKQFAWIERRENGVCYAYWHDDKKKRICKESLRTRDPEEAAKRFAKFLSVGPRQMPYAKIEATTVSPVLDWYYEEHVKPNVVDKDRQEDAITHLKAYFGDTAIKDVGIPESRAYAEARRKGIGGGGQRVGSDSTIRRELNVLVAAANRARKWKFITHDDLPQVELPPENPRRTIWLTKSQMRLVFMLSTGQLHDFCMLAYYLAARRRSIERLTVAQVDLQHGRINLDMPGRKLTKKRRSVVPIYPEIREVVERLMAASTTEHLFPGCPSMYRDFRKLCRKHGIRAQDLPDDKVPWPHLLRHSRASHMLQDGEDPYKVAKLLGDSIATVERVYGHHAVGYLQTKSTIDE